MLPPMMPMNKNPNNDPSVQFEPHLRNSQFDLDPSELKAEKILSKNKISEYDLINNSVWDEPGFETSSGYEEAKKNYAAWLKEKINSTSITKTWLTVLFLICFSALWAVVGVFMTVLEGKGVGGLFAAIVFAPAIEEVLKISAPLIVVEQRSFLFKAPVQIFLCCLCSGFFFAAIENLIYLNIYIQEPSELIVIWRWTVCVLLHGTSCSISSFGIISIWKRTICEFRKPELSLMNKYLISAIVLHSLYNTFAVIMEQFGFFR